MNLEIFRGILIPFLGTTLGAACVFFMKRSLSSSIQRALTGFAAGIMTAASVWSLLIPAMEQCASMGKLAFLPAAVGFLVGIFFLLGLAVTLHNIPEGMAVGVVYAGWASGNMSISAAAALALSVGIAIQNFPEGAIISMPLRAEGMGKGKAFLYGTLSGVVEPIGAVLTVLAAGLVLPILPYLLSFAAGAMIYVVVEELIPEMSEAPHSNVGTIFYAVGFVLMMTLDVALG